MRGNAELIKKKIWTIEKKTWCYENFSNICMNYVLFKFDFWCLLLVQQSSVISSTWEDYYYYYYFYYEVLNALHWLCTDVSLYQAQWLAHSRHLQEWISSVLQKKQGNKNYCSLSFSLSLWMITLPLSSDPQLFFSPSVLAFVFPSFYSPRARLFPVLFLYCQPPAMVTFEGSLGI